jgi:chromate transporter
MTTASEGQRPWLPPPRLTEILLTWFSIGIQSFGGGSTTLYLIRQACITRGWLTDAEFAKDWALVQISPGINLIKITAVIGHQLRGWPGLLAAICGLLLPSAMITVLMTAGFVIIRDWPFVKAAMRGVIPATIGISVGLGIQMAQAPLGRARREGRVSVGTHLALLAGSALLLAVAHASPVVVLALAGISGMLLLGDPVAAIRRTVRRSLGRPAR